MTAHAITHYAGCACFAGALPAALYSLRRDLRRARPVIAAAVRAVFPRSAATYQIIGEKA